MISFRSILVSCLVHLVLASDDDYDDDYNQPTSSAVSAAQREPEQRQQIIRNNVQMAHGILGCLAFAFFFPAGGIIIRVLPYRWTIWLHTAWQLFAYAMAIATMAMGIWMAQSEAEYMETYHARIGLVVVCVLFLQPFTGVVHHLGFKKSGGRTLFSYAHVFLGMALVTLGIINGGFGLQLAGAERRYVIVYGVLAAVVWLVWMGLSVLSQARRRRNGTPATFAQRKDGAADGPVDMPASHQKPSIVYP